MDHCELVRGHYPRHVLDHRLVHECLHRWEPRLGCRIRDVVQMIQIPLLVSVDGAQRDDRSSRGRIQVRRQAHEHPTVDHQLHQVKGDPKRGVLAFVLHRVVREGDRRLITGWDWCWREMNNALHFWETSRSSLSS